MKTSVCFFIFLLSVFVTMSFVLMGNDYSFEEDYFGQKPPGSAPELFGKGIISTSQDLHSCPVFSKDGKMVFWRIMNSGENNGVYFMELIDNTWTAPQKAPFVETESGDNNDVPYFSPNDEILYFLSDRAVKNLDRRKRVWQTMKENGVWIKPKLFKQINPKNVRLHWQFSIYLTGMYEYGKGAYDIYKAVLFNGGYVIEKFDPPISSNDSDICPYIAPDETYLIFCSSNRDDGYGECDLYICFKTLDGSWSTPINMGPEINSSSQDWCPIVSHDGKYLFFTSFRNGRCNAYWVDSSIISKLKETVL